MKKFFQEFREFAFKGNVVDLAVAVVIGGAFGKIVTSLVNDIIMPLVGLLIGSINFSELAYTVQGASGEPVSLAYGMFIQNVIDFLIVAFFIFLTIKGMNKFKRKKEEAPPAPPEPSKEELLLTEIRDILKEK